MISIRRPWLKWTVRALILAVVCWGVNRTLRGAIAELSQHEWPLRPGWLIASGLLYLLGLAPMGWFWYRILNALGQRTSLPASLRAYYLGHIGKYTPGKVMVVILRISALRTTLTSVRLAVVSILLETLTMMAVGAVLGAVLEIIEARLETRFVVAAAAVALLAVLPTLPPVARLLARLSLSRTKPPTDVTNEELNKLDLNASLRGIDLPLLFSGWIAALLCWLLLGLSLWATLRSIGLEQLGPISSLPFTIAAVSLAVVAGFVSMLPGGLVVRDALLMQVLASECGQANALVAALLLRLVWLVSELGICGILYIGAKCWRRGAGKKELSGGSNPANPTNF